MSDFAETLQRYVDAEMRRRSLRDELIVLEAMARYGVGLDELVLCRFVNDPDRPPECRLKSEVEALK